MKSTDPILIGRWAVIPASKAGERGSKDLRLDLTDSYCLRFAFNDGFNDGVRFAVGREAMQALLDAYDQMQARFSEAQSAEPSGKVTEA